MNKYEFAIPESVARKVCAFYNAENDRVLTVKEIDFFLSIGATCLVMIYMDAVTYISIYFLMQKEGSEIKTVLRTTSAKNCQILRTPVSIKTPTSRSESISIPSSRFRYVIYEKNRSDERIDYPEKLVDKTVMITKDGKGSHQIPIFSCISKNHTEIYYKWVKVQDGYYNLYRYDELLAKLMISITAHNDKKLKSVIDVLESYSECEDVLEILNQFGALAKMLGCSEIRIPLATKIHKFPPIDLYTLSKSGFHFQTTSSVIIGDGMENVQLPWIIA